MTIQEAIRKMAAAGTEPYCKVCTVDAVDEDARTVDCTPLDEGAPLRDGLLVLLRLEPLPHLRPRAIAVHVAELGVEPVA